MLDISTTDPSEACRAFAVRWLGLLADNEFAGAEALIDVNESGISFAESLPFPNGFTYGRPEVAEDWRLYLRPPHKSRHGEIHGCDFEVPFAESEFRPMIARFRMRRVGDQLEVRFQGLVPS